MAAPRPSLSELTNIWGWRLRKWNESEKRIPAKRAGIPSPLLPTTGNQVLNRKRLSILVVLLPRPTPDAFGIYIISMARQPSDVLAVQLLLKEVGCKFQMPIAPLFETWNDLQNAAAVLNRLLSVEWYRNYIRGQQYVMIGYSDSAKDAGMMSAGWAQYRAMEEPVV